MQQPTHKIVAGPNWVGLWSLYYREVLRFLRTFLQTLAAPIIAALMFHMVFSIAFGGQGRSAADIPFTEFLVPGLIMMAVLMGCYQNSSSTMTMAKVLQNIVDTLMSPLSAFETTAGYILAGITRGLVTALAVGGVLMLIQPLEIHHLGYALFHVVGAGMALSLIGLIGAIWAERIDHIAAVTNFVIMPLSFLSGTFYSIQHLPPLVQEIARYNPVFYMIDGFRYGILGHADEPLITGVLVVIGVNIVLWAICQRMFYVGYRLKA